MDSNFIEYVISFRMRNSDHLDSAIKRVQDFVEKNKNQNIDNLEAKLSPSDFAKIRELALLQPHLTQLEKMKMPSLVAKVKICHSLVYSVERMAGIISEAEVGHYRPTLYIEMGAHKKAQPLNDERFRHYFESLNKVISFNPSAPRKTFTPK